MRFSPRLIAALALLLVGGRAARAQNSITVSGNPPLMRITTAVAGSQPTAITTATTTYTVVVATGGTRRVTGRLDAAMPVGTTVTVSLAAPPGATSLGAVTLDLTERDLVINIPRPTTATLAITYRFSATVSAGVIANSIRNVTLRLRT
jgi:hypothetical protein